ncbi:MAG: NAD(P)/FAD-dependent oxidoreductase [Ignavibacterium sp.]|nr:MAG: NAD(P)/FAD-dependent oxidoreductase [Ignavibacterium sp.]
MDKKKVIIIGGGFGGLSAAKDLVKHPFDITLIDKTNHHLFQPLLYQVATAALSPGDIANPIRSVFRKTDNINIIMAEATSIDKENRTVSFNNSAIQFDFLIFAAGVQQFYFGKDEWEPYAPGLKTLNDALKIRENILHSLETAERLEDADERKQYLNFVIVGGGATGVELAGAIAEIVNKNLIRDYKNINSKMTKVFLIEAHPEVLNIFPETLSKKASEDLKQLGVEVFVNKRVSKINEEGVWLGDELVKSKNIIWAAGNRASPLLLTLNVDLDNFGRVEVNEDLSLPDFQNIFVLGDAAAYKDEKGNLLPALAPVAIQQGKFVANIIANNLTEKERGRFRYRDKGTMATIGKARAVAVIKGLKLSGLFAWLTWCVVHIMYLISYRNRLRVMLEWAWHYVTNRPGIRLIVKDSSKDTDSYLA